MSAAVEGIVDDAVVRKLLAHAGGEVGTVYGRRGKSYLREKIHGFGQAARYSPWIVLVDLNESAPCAPALIADWLADPAGGRREPGCRPVKTGLGPRLRRAARTGKA